MELNLAFGVFLGLVILIVVLFAVLRRLTVSKERQLSAEEFRQWFAKVFLGLQIDSIAGANPEARAVETEKAQRSPRSHENRQRGS
jgi:nitrate reductase gamma subunit